MSDIIVQGVGIVSPAGWSLNAFRDALAKGEIIPAQALPPAADARPLRARMVPAPSPRPAFFSHGRLRRSSRITQFAVGAALEALGQTAPGAPAGQKRLGLVLTVMAGCVNYSGRFYDEVLRDPATASPMIFPETVFNAPASHLAAFLGTTELSYTLVGDPGMFLQGVALAADWLRADRVDGCLVVAAEESDPLIASAYRPFARGTVLSEGAGALYLTYGPAAGRRIILDRVTSAYSFLAGRGRRETVCRMRAELPLRSDGCVLCDSSQGVPRLDDAESDAWADWTGPRISVKRLLGEGLAAGSAWQCVAAVDALRNGASQAAVVSVVGCNQQAVGAHFVSAGSAYPGLDS